LAAFSLKGPPPQGLTKFIPPDYSADLDAPKPPDAFEALWLKVLELQRTIVILALGLLVEHVLATIAGTKAK
jgi:hypothetical protein